LYLRGEWQVEDEMGKTSSLISLITLICTQGYREWARLVYDGDETFVREIRMKVEIRSCPT